MRYIGLDVHKNNTTACIIANNGKPVTEIPDFELHHSEGSVTGN